MTLFLPPFSHLPCSLASLSVRGSTSAFLTGVLLLPLAAPRTFSFVVPVRQGGISSPISPDTPCSLCRLLRCCSFHTFLSPTLWVAQEYSFLQCWASVLPYCLSCSVPMPSAGCPSHAPSPASLTSPLTVPSSCFLPPAGVCPCRFSVSVRFVHCHTQSPPRFSLAKVVQAQSSKYHSGAVIDVLFSKSFGAGHKTFTLS